MMDLFIAYLKKLGGKKMRDGGQTFSLIFKAQKV